MWKLRGVYRADSAGTRHAEVLLSAAYVATPPDYVPRRLVRGERRKVDGAVTIIPFTALRDSVGDVASGYVYLQRTFPDRSIVLTDKSTPLGLLDMRNAIPLWAHAPLLRVDLGCEGLERQLRSALTGDDALTTEFLVWATCLWPRLNAISPLVECLLDQPFALSTKEALARRGYATRTAGRYLRRAGFVPPGDVRRLFRGIFLVSALQNPMYPTVERVAHTVGYSGGSSVSHLLRGQFGLSTGQVRGRLGWKWVALRYLRRIGSRI